MFKQILSKDYWRPYILGEKPLPTKFYFWVTLVNFFLFSIFHPIKNLWVVIGELLVFTIFIVGFAVYGIIHEWKSGHRKFALTFGTIVTVLTLIATYCFSRLIPMTAESVSVYCG